MWLVACGLWLVACGLWLVACGLWLKKKGSLGCLFYQRLLIAGPPYFLRSSCTVRSWAAASARRAEAEP
ncbi:MAG: hypothetical protein CVV07_08950 [Gammaproteobacteria bacterium HGW-Gammaproteobacteria-11]|nr:MAG: hypothetical protein CVV07_08950 [Gammaproteobacteria bacterium HGW-Gammaproteobacteria-11]